MFEVYEHIESKYCYQKGKVVPREFIQSIYAYKGLISTAMSQFQIFENEPADLNSNCYAKLKNF